MGPADRGEGMRMWIDTRHVFGTAGGLVLTACLLLPESAALAQRPRTDYRKLDLADFLDLGKYYVKPAPAKKDARTGLIVGGKNDTALIRGLREINGRTIADLERDMR